MKKYFYANGKEKLGPFSFEELRNENINSNTLIWFQGLDNWTAAKYILDIKEILEVKPPPIQLNSVKEVELKMIVDDLSSSLEETDSFYDSNQKMFSDPFSFSGRIRRKEYGISIIIYFLLALFINFISAIIGLNTGLIVNSIFFIPLLWFIWAQGAKRCHDIGNSGWFQIIPFYFIWIIFAKGQEGDSNKYGLNPKLKSAK